MTSPLAKNVRRVKRLMALSAVMMTAGGCTHHSLDCMPVTDGVTVKVEFDWGDTSVDPPREMTVHFFPENEQTSTSVSIYDFKTLEGGLAYLRPGRYMAICYNSDAGGYNLSGRRSFYDFGMQLRDASVVMPVAAGAQDERMAGSPDEIWAGALEVMEVPTDDSDLPIEVPRATIRFNVESVVQRFTVRIKEAKNYNRLTVMRASISGLAGEYHPGRQAMGDEPVTLSMQLRPLDDGSLEGSMITFGHCGAHASGGRGSDEAQTPHYLVICAVLADGSSWAKNYDVTQRIHSSSHPHPVLELQSLTLPEMDTGDGFRPTVGEWVPGSSEEIGM